MAAPRAEIPVVVLSESTPISYVAGASVFVKLRANEATAKVFANSGASEAELGQPLSSDALGRITGWLERGSYKFEITIPGKSPYTEYLDVVPATDGSVTTAFLAGESVTAEKVAAANKDGTAGTPSMRTLGTGSTQAAAGNDSRFTNERIPTAASVTTEKLGNAAVTTAKIAAGVIPSAGAIWIWPGATAPAGTVLCNGASYTKAAQEALWAAIEYRYGGSGANFNVPDLRGCVVVGVDAGAGRLDNGWAPATLAARGGSMWLQAHAHSPGSISTRNQQFQPQQYISGQYNMYSPQSSFNSVTGWTPAENYMWGTTDISGSGNSQNMPPYLVLNYVIKT